MTSPYDLEMEHLLSEIARSRAKRILIQIPDGLKPDGVNLSKTIEEETSTEVFLSSSACYGACDLAVDQARLLGVDLIIHYGHTPFGAVDGPPVVFLDARSRLDVTSVLSKADYKLSGLKKIGLATTVQHLGELDMIRRHLEGLGIETVMTPAGGRSLRTGQIIGCDYTPLKMIASKVDSFIIIGSKFHAMGASIAVDKPVILVDPYSNQVIDMKRTREAIIRRRYAAITKAKNARVFGIILGTKPGQHDPAGALSLKEEINGQGRTATIIVVDEISPDSLENFREVEIFVNTACPRLAIDDTERFTRPILSPREALVAIGELEWEDLLGQGLL